VEATIFSTEEPPPPKTRFMGASPYSLGRANPWPVGCLCAALAASARIDEILGGATIHEHDPLTWHSFAIEWGALLQRMINVIGDADILTEELFCPYVRFRQERLSARAVAEKIIKKKADEIEHGGGFEDDGVNGRGASSRAVDSEMRLFGRLGRRVSADRRARTLAELGFGPALRRKPSCMVMEKLGVRFAIGGKKAARIRQGRTGSGRSRRFQRRPGLS